MGCYSRSHHKVLRSRHFGSILESSSDLFPSDLRGRDIEPGRGGGIVRLGHEPKKGIPESALM